MISRDEPAPTSIPRRAPRRLVTTLVVLGFILLLTLRGIATIWTDYLWFDSVDATSVWTTLISTQVVLGAFGTVLAFAVVWANLVVADRISPRFQAHDLGPEEELVERFQEWVEPRLRRFRVAVAAVFSLMIGVGASGWWRDWLLYRNKQTFGIEDPIFNRDVSFYVFDIPLYRDLISWLFQLIVVSILLVAALHYLNAGIRLRQGRVPEVSAGVKAHLSVLLAVLALLKAAAYRLDGYELLYSDRGAVFGASYTDVTAHRPALALLALISLFGAALLLWNIRRRGWTLPAVAAGLWLVVSVVVGGIIPAAIERFRVQPNQFNLERQYIDNHIKFTLDAYGMGEGQVEIRQFAASPDLTADDIASNQPTINNVRLWDPGVLEASYSELQEIRPYYQIANVDVDRYVIDGELTQVMVAARELDSNDLPAEGWVNEKLVYTHGYGQVYSRANDVNPTTGEPAFLVRDVPPVSTVEELVIDQPRIYFGETADTGSYVIVRTNQQEVDFPSGAADTVVRNTYEGDGGVELSNLAIRAAMALRFGDLNTLISPELNPDSKILMVRNIVDRLAMVAPFLHADGDPYLALIGGRAVWIVDLYSTTDRYPYSQPAIDGRLNFDSPLPRDFNYIRNSVKAVVDAEHGSMDLYVLEGADPLTRAYQQIFPEVFTDFPAMTDELREHLRYPEDMFRVQSDMYATYHQIDPEDFFQEEDKWDIPRDPSTSSRIPVRGDAFDSFGNVDRSRRLELPYYLLMRLPEENDLSYLAFQSFNPASRENMTAFMVAKSGPEDYGELIDYRLPRGELINGLQQISARIDQDPVISQQFTLLGQQGSEIIRGNLLIIPVEESLLFVQPIYLRGEDLELPEFKRVVVVFGEETPPIMRETLEEALFEIFGDGSVPPPTDPPPTNGDPIPIGDDVQQLVLQIDQLLTEANDALLAGDLGLYQSKVNEAALLIEALRALVEDSQAP